jgi:hypothetical protein
MAQAAARRAEPIGRAVCVGVSAGADAGTFAALALERGFLEPALLLEEEASRAAVRAKVREMASVSRPGDFFLLTFSGHGGRTRLRGRGEVGTWQLYDGTLNEEQLETDLSGFREGVRVLVVSDNCGGGIPRSPQSPGGSERIEERSVGARLGGARADALSCAGHDVLVAPLSRPGHDGVVPPLSRPAIEGFLKASVLVLAACRQGMYADGPGLPGHFSEVLKRVLNGGGSFNGPYSAFHEALCQGMPSYQQPDYYRLGTPNAIFEAQSPFTI